MSVKSCRPFDITKWYRYLILWVIVTQISCDYEPVEGSARMKYQLAQIYKEAQPGQYTHRNAQMAEYYLQQADKAEGEEFLRYIYLYLRESLYAGKYAEVIEKTQRLMKEQGQTLTQMNMKSRQFWDLLAIAYMRKGEFENCIDNHSAASCIVPIKGAGIHTLQQGSRQAIEIYQQILRQFPRDDQARWLLNIAYMNLGEYPERVPEKWLIEGISSDSIPLEKPFVNVALGKGLDVNELSGGTCMEDFDKDGDLDIMASSYGLEDQVRLFLNNGDGTFEDVTYQSGLEGILSGLNMIHADYNNDGLEDVLVLRGGWLGKEGTHPNSLLKNKGDGRFEDVTYNAGIYSERPTQTATWADFNLDGWLDLFIGNESSPDQEFPSELYVNNGDGTFTEIAEKLGLEVNEYIKGVTWGDVNNDGYPDLYISILQGTNKLFINHGGTTIDDWTFIEESADYHVLKPEFSFPTWFWDVNNDGWQDLFVAAYPPGRMFQVAFDEGNHYLNEAPKITYPQLYLNNQEGSFTDVTVSYGLDRPMYAMGSNFGDFDNDGFLDFYVGTGAPDLRSIVPNLAFHNYQGKWFRDVTFSSGLGFIQKGHAVSFGDMDQDGDQDIYTVLGGAVESDIFPNALLVNPGNNFAWITLKLEGVEANRSAIGARVSITTVEDDGSIQVFYRTVSTGGSFGSSSLQLEVGLGNAERVERVDIQWPDQARSTQTFDQIEINRAYRIEQGIDQPEVISVQPFDIHQSDHMMHP